jgi:hypothetical protein
MPTYRAVDVGFVLPGRPRHLDKIEDDGDVLDLYISGEDGTKLLVKCDSYLFYGKRDEGNAIRTVGSIAADTSLDSLVFSVADSWLLAWFVAECEGMRKVEDLKHFIVACANDLIDIISVDDLAVEVLRVS